MKSLVLAEKPSVGKEIGRVLQCNRKQKAFWEGDRYVVTWAMGHLIELAEPADYDEKYRQWDLAYLPMLPEKMKHTVIRKTSHQYRAITSLMRRSDIGEVIIATDAGREGELVARWILRLGGWKGKYRRLWISSQTDAAIRDGFSRLADGRLYDNLFRAAECRAEADWIIGINLSRALSCKYDTRLSAGRVQTPTLSMIVDREKEIESFVPESYWTVEADFGRFTAYRQGASGASRIRDASAADAIVARVAGKQGTIESVSRKRKNEPPPLAYDLTALQRDANVQLGFSAKQTLNVLQILYERYKYVTYPRTDSRYITSDVAATIPARLDAIIQTPFGGTVKELKRRTLSPGKRFINDANVTDHHAIIPTEERVNVDRLSGDERALWMLVVRRFLAVLSAPRQYEQITVTVNIAGERFIAGGTHVTDPGWRRIDTFRDEEESDPESVGGENVHACREGDDVRVESVRKREGFTRPPGRYTEATLLGAMEDAGRFVKDQSLKESIARGGLGTPATRAEIIEKIISSYYVERRGKELFPTPRGVELLELVPEPLKSPTLTAKWERRLGNIEAGTEQAAVFSRAIRSSAVELVDEVRQSKATYTPKNTSGKACPVCGKPLIKAASKRGETFVCQALSCGYEEESTPDDRPNSRPTQKERATARRYMKTYQAQENEGSSFADLIRAAEERRKHGSR